MTNPNGAKGKGFERDVVRFLEETFGRRAYRPHAEGFKDVGDVHLEPFALQAKNYANVATALTAGVAGAVQQAEHAGLPFGAAVIKKRGSNVREARVAMRLVDFSRLVARLHEAEESAAELRTVVDHLRPKE